VAGHLEIFFNVRTLVDILKTSGVGKPTLLLPNERNLRPDITNTDTLEVFEIKPGLARADAADRQQEGARQLQSYLDGLNRATPANAQFRGGTGYHGELGIKF
jgi:hypothetical protein